MAKAGYECVNFCDGPKGARHSTMEFWTGKSGVVICQFWDQDGVNTFADWPTGITFEELEKFLSKARPK